MARKPWKPVDLPVIEDALGSGLTFELPSSHWPSWAQSSTQLQRLWVYCPDEETTITSSGTTAEIIGRLLTERYDPKDLPKPYNYNFHLLAESSAGGYLQSPPFRSSDPTHHSSAPPDWLESYESPFDEYEPTS